MFCLLKDIERKINRFTQKIEFAAELVADTAWALFDIFTLTEKELTNTEPEEAKKIFEEDQEYLKNLRKRDGTYKYIKNGKWFRDLGWAEEIIFIGKQPQNLNNNDNND
jgi:hypothetical protein